MNDTLWLLFDGSMVLLLWALAWLACATRDVRQSITLFIAFGLLLALVWARLNAPDLALAEAAIGAGISGALLLAALRDGKAVGGASDRSAGLIWAINLLVLGLFLLMSHALWRGLQTPADLQLAVEARTQLVNSGVSNPVTAVLLNYRAYDTLLELAVVLTAVLGILALSPMRVPPTSAGPLLLGLTRWLVPLLVVTSGYLLWVGAHAPGGAFQAGAVLASAMILQYLAPLPGRAEINPMLLRSLLVAGLAVFVAVGLLMMPFNGSFLQYFRDSAGGLILVIETAATLSIAAALTLAYVGGHPSGWYPTTQQSSGKDPQESPR